MIRWLEGNAAGVALASVCGGLLLVSLLLGVLWSLPPSATGAQADDTDEIPELDVPELADNEPLAAFAVITERPVFNISRLPVIDDETDGADDELLDEEDVDAPDVQLAGVVITPTIRMVTLRSSDQPQSLVAFEGQPLEGNYGSWQVSRIDPREITLSSGSGEEVQLKLEVHNATITPPPQPEPEKAADPVAEAEPAQDGEQPMTRAEEIRQRIAQRREELRRAAEENEPGQKKDGEPKADYRSAIQSMISGDRKKKQPDENER